MITNSETFLFQDSSLNLLTYYIESQKEAVVIDPMRDYEPYVNFLKERNVTLKYILLTHIPSDYVSGCLDLSRQTGAPIIIGQYGYLQYENRLLNDGEEISFGNCFIKAIHSPGHTIESTCYVLMGESRKAHSVYTGDTLLVESLCFPDGALLRDKNERELGLLLHESLAKLKQLDNDVIVYPGHTAGNISVKRAGANNSSTIGDEKDNNPYLKIDEPEVFIKSLLSLKVDLKNKFFLVNIARINIEGYDPLSETMGKVNKGISPEVAERKAKTGDYIILDTRDREKMNNGIIKGSITIPLKEQFCIWAGLILKWSERIIVLHDAGKEEEVLKALIKIGRDHIEGFVCGGVEKWTTFGLSLVNFEMIKTDDVCKYLYNRDYKLLDIREEVEHENGVLPYSVFVPFSKLEANLHLISKDETLYIFCKRGGRSVMAYSFLKRLGYDNIIILENGLMNMEKFNIPLIMK
jgi:hydroxyacylglutathione hydrolase